MTTYLVSDLHLDASRPAATKTFKRFLRDEATGADALYILGDLFEAWIGDDDTDEHHQQILTAIASVSEVGTDCYFIRGNRDYLLRDAAARRAGMRLLNDGSVVTIEGERVMLMHGDVLCTDDHAYQRLRRITRTPWVQGAFLRLPLAVRRRIAGVARRRSQASNATKPAAIMDVNPQSVIDAMRTAEVRLLIHGHTHRPAIHSPGEGGAPLTRIVLGDWYEQGSVLVRDASGYRLESRTMGAEG